MKSQLLIPGKIKVGFNLRNDTYTGKLGYVIYHDGKAWRKEASWESWREKHVESEKLENQKRAEFERQIKQQTDYYHQIVDSYNKNKNSNDWYKKIAEQTLEEYLKERHLNDYSRFQYYSPNKEYNNPSLIPLEFDNVPTEGFVLNKKAGGYSSGWNHRATYCRVYDPRGFEFEISIPNLLFILQETSSFKGKGLEGEFVYSWEGKDLVLLPTCCEDYKKSANFTKLQEGKVGVKDLIEGCSYKTKKEEELTYLGKFNCFNKQYSWHEDGCRKYSKDYVFVNKKGGHVNLTSLSSLSMRLTDTPVSNYSELVDNFMKSKSSITSIKNLEASTTQVQFRKDDDYYYYGRRARAGVFDVTLDGQYFLEVEPNKYKLCNIDAQIKRDGSYYGTKVQGYAIRSNKLLTFDNGEINVKALNEKDEKVYTKDDLKKMSFKKLAIVTNTDKKYTLTV